MTGNQRPPWIKRHFANFKWHFFVVMFLLVIKFIVFLNSPLLTEKKAYILTLRQGESATELYNTLTENRHLSSKWMFKVVLRFSSHATKLQAGTYHLNAKLTPLALLKKISKGEVITSSFTIVPGMAFKDIVEALQKAPYLKHSQSVGVAIMSTLSLKRHALEGSFLPDTYQYPAGSLDVSLLQRSYMSMQKYLDEVWRTRDTGLPYETPRAMLTVASIIEKETGIPGEREWVSAVIRNRLNKNMRLQMDPTVIYALGNKYDGDIKKKQLKVDNAFNTYLYKGLPPTPIAMPSKASLIAAAHPADVAYLYFVAKGDGGHQFSLTLKEQTKAVRQYQRKKK